MERLLQKNLFCCTIENQPLLFEETLLGGITHIPYHEDARINTNPSQTFIKFIQIYKANVEKIRARYEESLEAVEDVDLSQLGLTLLPPHMLLECKQARTLNISGNSIHFLPIQLKNLPLRSLNISGNRRLQPNIPEWLGEMDLTLTAHDIGLDFIPEGFTPARVISRDIPSRLKVGPY